MSCKIWIVAGLVCYGATSCHPFKVDIPSAARNRAANTNSCLYLFDSLFQNDEKRQQRRSLYASSSPNQISEEELRFIGNGFGLEKDDAPPFPYLLDGKSKPNTRLVVRHLEDEDITKILPEVVREFGALAPSLSSSPNPGDELAEKIENYLFSLTVLIGLTQRVVRRQKGYDESNSACPDHNVICLVEKRRSPSNNTSDGEAGYSEQIVGIAELSYQPPNPNSNAPPFVLPYFMKTLISRFSPSRDGSEASAPVGYVSNVLVWKTRRGLGYGRILMAALEGIANLWGCDDVRLHVDANEYSGRIARSLYWSLGYEGVPDRGTSKNNKVGYGWMGPEMSNQGLYLVDGVPLLYLRKSLKYE